MNVHDDVICQVRESFSGLYMEVPVEKVFFRSRLHRRRRLSRLAAAGAAAAVAGVAAGLTLTAGAPPSPRTGAGPAANPRHFARLAAFSLASGPGQNTTLIMRKGPGYHLNPSVLRSDLAERGIPALVTVGRFCRSTPGPSDLAGPFSYPSKQPDDSEVMVINGRAMPAGTRLSIGYFGNAVKVGLIRDGARLSCSSASHQPVVHIIPSGPRSEGDK